MPQNPEMRASDRDREEFAEILRENFAQGRLTQDELHERLEALYETRTLGGLQRLTADLPAQDLYDLPLPAARSSTSPARPHHPGGARIYQAALKAGWGTWASVNLITFVIWVITSVTSNGPDYPWFLWVAGPWGAILLAATLFGPRPSR